MERRHIKWLPLLLAGLFFAYQYFSSEKFVNPETGRKSHVAMSTREEASLGVQSYQQVLAQSKSVNLAQVANTQYILSNYHVFESDIIPGGDNTVATTGDPIIQPGLIDVNCNVNGAQTVATLVKKSSLPNSNVDCSIGKVVTGQVRQQRLDSGD